MASPETNIVQRILLTLGSLPYCRMFRNNTFSGWAGKSYQEGNKRIVVDAYPVKGGLCNGSSDTIGITSITITPEMIGKTIGVFTAIELKTLKGGNGSDEQKAFIALIQRFGGIAGIARSESEALEILENYKLNLIKP